MSIRNRIIFIVLALLASTPAHSMLLEYSLDRMVAECDAVAQGRILSLESRWLDGPNSIIVTDVVFAVDEVMTGAMAAGQELHFYVVGGTVDGLTMRQEHQPIFTPGEETVLFFWTQPDQRRLAVFNDEQGRYKVTGDSVVNFKQQTIPLIEFRQDLEQAISSHKR